MDLIDYGSSVFSQQGEDGIIDRIFSLIGPGQRRCCEFGAWDGIHLSNTRALVLSGWHGVLVESDPGRFRELCATYADLESATCLKATMGLDGSLADLLTTNRLSTELDFLSIDIDGLDYEVMGQLGVKPRVICVEVNAGHSPTADGLVAASVVKRNVGQPLQAFITLADELGYRLLCYTGNAFFIRSDIAGDASLPTLSGEDAYEQFLQRLNQRQKRWLMLVNKGAVPPFFQYDNPYLQPASLGLVWRHRVAAVAEQVMWRVRGAIR